MRSPTSKYETDAFVFFWDKQDERETTIARRTIIEERDRSY